MAQSMSYSAQKKMVEPEVTFEDLQALEQELERLKRTETDLQDYSLGT